MEYKIVTMPQRTVAGITARTSNFDQDMQAKIGGLWQRFFEQGVYASLPDKASQTTIGLYHCYESDFRGAYDLTVCAQVADTARLPEGVEAYIIPGGTYAEFVVHGGMDAVGACWNELWKMNLNRAYTCDYEEYFPGENPNDTEIHIYLSVKEENVMNENKQLNFCQSCGMPLSEENQLGTNADQSKNGDYCVYCYKNGAFTADCTMDEMIEFCVPMCSKGQPYPDEETARREMKAFFPQLKRWKQG